MYILMRAADVSDNEIITKRVHVLAGIHYTQFTLSTVQCVLLLVIWLYHERYDSF